MIQKLIIKNYLIIKEAEINFKYGFNVLTGETGAGKTIILDAISLLLGERADYSIIKKDKEKLVIEGFFEFKEFNKINNFLKRKDIESDIKNGINDIILRRELSKKGNSRCFINDTPVLISDMKEFGDLIVDIHSQNEHQSLLRKDTHTEVLDSFLIDNKVLNEFKKIYFYYKEKFENFNKRLKNKENLEDRKSFIEFQLREINNLNPSESEDELIENELKKLENTEEIDLSVNNVLDLLSEKENNVINNIFLSIKESGIFPITDQSMTRFMITLEQGVELVWHALEDMVGGEIYVKKIPSMKITDLAIAINPNAELRFVGIRPGEKLHEQMIALEDAPYTYEYDGMYKILPVINEWYKDLGRIKNGNLVNSNFSYCSNNNEEWMSIPQLEEWISLNQIGQGV